MRRTRFTLLPLALLLALAPAALGLVVQYNREEVGPAKEANAAKGATPESDFRLALNRCYWRESGWDGWGASNHETVAAFRGDVDEANAALATFAALPAGEKEVQVFPAPGSVRSADGKASHACDWEVRWSRHTHVPNGDLAKPRAETHTAVLTLFVARAGPVPEADPRAGRWVRELNDDSFPVRERASRSLADQGEAALPALREGLARSPSPEQRRRIGRLLDRLRPIHLSRVKVPKGVRVIALDRLVAEAVGDWRSGDLGRSWLAATRLAEWAEHSEDTRPPLAEALRDQREQVRTLAAAALARLKGQTERPDGPGAAERWRENRRLRRAIAEHCRSALRQP